MRLPTSLLIFVAMLAACDRKPPSDAEMTAALQTAFDLEAQQDPRAPAVHIASLKSRNCERTAMVGPVIYSCEVVLTIGARDSAPRRVLFHQTEKGWIVPP